MCHSKTASVGKIWNFDFRRIPFEQKEEVKQIRLLRMKQSRSLHVAFIPPWLSFSTARKASVNMRNG